MQLNPYHKIILLFGLACLGLIIYVVLDNNNVLATIQDGKVIQAYVESFGNIGPIIIILLMMIAILFSPLPSAPIAIAAGAVYGHTWGTIYVIIGSISGASAAFLIARYLGYDFIEKMTRNYLPAKFFHSQNALMGIVLASRLMPFLSFDVISYAAGLTPLLFWRFALATLLGIIPASFFLAHVGSEVASGELNRIALAILALAVLTGVLFLINLLRNKTKRGT